MPAGSAEHLGSGARIGRQAEVSASDAMAAALKEAVEQLGGTLGSVPAKWARVKKNPPGTAGFSPCFHLPGFVLGTYF